MGWYSSLAGPENIWAWNGAIFALAAKGLRWTVRGVRATFLIMWRKKRRRVVSRERKKYSWRDFPGGTVDKNPPASRGNTGMIPGSGRFHVLQRS